MIAAIFCPGPSLMRTWPDCGLVYDLTLAVNTAGKLVQADWLCASDGAFYRGLLGDCQRPRAGILCLPDAVSEARAWGGPLEVRGWDEVPSIGAHQRRGRPINWTVQAALCLAADLGACRADLCGADCVGTVDASGYRGEDRTAERWEREERDLSWTRTILAERGITVQRITL